MSKRPKSSLAEQVAKDIQVKHKDPLAASTLEGGGRAGITEVCPTGSLVIDHHVMGVGGLPWGRVYEFSGPEGSGKTTLGCRLMAMAQRDGALPVISDKENKLHTGWAAVHGLDLGNVVEYPAPCIEAYGDEILRLLSKYGGRTHLMFLLDSVPALLPRAYLTGDIDDTEQPGAAGKAWSRLLSHVSAALLERKGMLVLLNQIRAKIGVMFGPTEDTPSGKAIKHYCTARFSVSHGKSITEGKEKVGRYMQVMAFKNQVVSPFRRAELKMVWDKGFDDKWSVVNYAKDVGCLEDTKDVRAYPEALQNLGWSEYAEKAEAKGGEDGGAG